MVALGEEQEHEAEQDGDPGDEEGAKRRGRLAEAIGVPLTAMPPSKSHALTKTVSPGLVSSKISAAALA